MKIDMYLYSVYLLIKLLKLQARGVSYKSNMNSVLQLDKNLNHANTYIVFFSFSYLGTQIGGHLI
jgi:hypothetical protein